jgi:arylsulfatase A-like enzyme
MNPIRLLACTAASVLAAVLVRGADRVPWNVVFITLDTTRADHIGAYGLSNAGTPTIDNLAHEGVLFEQAETVAPLTLPSHCSLFTGRYPFQHSVHENGDLLPVTERTLAQVLHERGYQTAAFTASYVLEARWGLARGFDRYDDVQRPHDGHGPGRNRRPANEVVDAALDWLGTAERSPFFVWLHMYDAHAPYDREGGPRIRDYQSAIAYMDTQINRVLGFLDGRRLRDRTLIIIAGDHGESLGDHGERTHGFFVYESVTRVPLIVVAPIRSAQGRRIPEVVRTVDVLPTVLELLHIRTPTELAGVSLAARLTGVTQSQAGDAYSETMYPRDRFGWSELRAIRSDRFKAIAAPRPELYDLERDPSETVNLVEERPALADFLLTKLRAFAFDHRSHPSAGPVERDAADRLAALGYVGRTAVPERSAEVRPDPKDKLSLYLLITSDRTRDVPGSTR